MKEFLLQELKDHYGKIFVFFSVLALVLYGIHFFGDILERKAGTNLTVQSPTVNLSSDGTVKQAPGQVYVTVAAQDSSQSTMGVQQKTEKSKEDLKVAEKQNYSMTYNGKEYTLTPDFTETTKLEKAQLVVNREANMKINIDLPHVSGFIGPAYSMKGNSHIGVMAGKSLGKNGPFMATGYASSADQAIGIAATWYTK